MATTKVFRGGGSNSITIPAGVKSVRVNARGYAKGLSNFQFNNFQGTDSSQYGIDIFGTMWACGINANGQLGVAADVTPRSSPTLVLGGLTWKQVASTGTYAVGLTTTGIAYGWGKNDKGQAGVGDTTPRSSPVLVVGSLVFSSIVCIPSSFYGLTPTGSLYTWGANSVGALGVNDNTARSSPTLVVGGLLFSKVTGSNGNIFGLTHDGKIYSWGSNSSGQLGDGTTTGRSSPVLIAGGITNWVDVVASQLSAAFGLTADGNLYAWGSNSGVPWGALGVGDVVDRSSPTLVVGNIKWAQIFAGYSTNMAVDRSGNLYGWGANDFYELDNTTAGGTPTRRSSPVLVHAGALGTSVSRMWRDTSNMNNFALTKSGDLYAWGNYPEGTGTGNFATGSASSPTLVAGGFKWQHFYTSANGYSLGINSRGQAYAWGQNLFGQVGDGTTAVKSSPVLVLGTKFYDYEIPGRQTVIPVTPGSTYTLTIGAYGAVFGGTTVGSWMGGIQDVTVSY